MYDNIGGKIKGLAGVLFVITAIAEVIGGIVIMAEDMVGYGVLVMFGGPVLSWISSWLLYGFGQLIENSDKLVKNLCKTNGTQGQLKKTQSENETKQEPSYTETGTCELCGKAEASLIYAKIVDDMGTRYRHICKDCYEKNNTSPAK